jgi:hypothetical protein
MFGIKSGYDNETVRKMLEIATAKDCTLQDVSNLCRRGALLYHAQIHPGFFGKVRTDHVITAILRRRLAAQLGRVSPRLLDSSHDLTCNTCQGIAVKWEGRWLCQNGHGGTTNE